MLIKFYHLSQIFRKAFNSGSIVFNDISLARYHIRQSRMIYLRCKYDIISVLFIREAYIICVADIIASAISPVTAGNGYH